MSDQGSTYAKNLKVTNVYSLTNGNINMKNDVTMDSADIDIQNNFIKSTIGESISFATQDGGNAIYQFIGNDIVRPDELIVDSLTNSATANNGTDMNMRQKFVVTGTESIEITRFHFLGGTIGSSKNITDFEIWTGTANATYPSGTQMASFSDVASVTTGGTGIVTFNSGVILAPGTYHWNVPTGFSGGQVNQPGISGKKLWANSSEKVASLRVTIYGTLLDEEVPAEIRIYGNTSAYTGLKSSVLEDSYTLTLPAADGMLNEVMLTDGTGNLSFGGILNTLMDDNGNLDMQCLNIGNVEILELNTMTAKTGTITAGNTIVMAAAKQIHFTNGIEIGISSLTTNNNGIAIGLTASAGSGIAIGKQTINSFGYSLVLGYQARSDDQNCIAIGREARAEAFGSIAIGSSAGKPHTQGIRSIAIGGNCTTGSNATNSIALGDGVVVDGTGSISIGKSSYVSGNLSVCLGYNAYSSFDNSICIGNGAVTAAEDEIILGRPISTVGLTGTAETWGQIFQNRSWDDSISSNIAGIDATGNFFKTSIETSSLSNLPVILSGTRTGAGNVTLTINGDGLTKPTIPTDTHWCLTLDIAGIVDSTPSGNLYCEQSFFSAFNDSGTVTTSKLSEITSLGIGDLSSDNIFVVGNVTDLDVIVSTASTNTTNWTATMTITSVTG